MQNIGLAKKVLDSTKIIYTPALTLIKCLISFYRGGAREGSLTWRSWWTFSREKRWQKIFLVFSYNLTFAPAAGHSCDPGA